VGLVEAAHRGRLFLNEIGDSTPDLQKCFLDLVQNRRFRKVGEVDYTRVDVAFIAATHRDLRALSKTGDFRSDLYHRLRVFEIRVPPLRHRTEEIPEIVRAFLEHFSRQNSKTPVSIDDDALGLLLRYPWPGNVRELAHCIECLVVRAPTDRINGPLVSEFIDSDMDSPGDARPEPRGKEAERTRMEEILRQHGGNKLHAARALGIHRATLYRRLNRLSLTSVGRP
jgi:DNA-binding NtrC family response regulator